MQVHVVLRVEVVVQDRVDVLQVNHARVLVEGPKLGVRLVEVAPTGGSCQGHGSQRAAAHGLGEEIEMRVPTHINLF